MTEIGEQKAKRLHTISELLWFSLFLHILVLFQQIQSLVYSHLVLNAAGREATSLCEIRLEVLEAKHVIPLSDIVELSAGSHRNKRRRETIFGNAEFHSAVY